MFSCSCVKIEIAELWGRSSEGERWNRTPEVAGSNPAASTSKMTLKPSKIRSFSDDDFQPTERPQRPQESHLSWERVVQIFLWVKATEGRSVNTVEWFANHLRLFLRFHKEKGLECLSPATCSHTHVRLYLASLMERGLSPASLRTYFNALSVFFNWCVKEGIARKNPCDKVEKPKVPQTIPTPVTAEHFTSAIKSLKPDRFIDLMYLALFHFAFDTGCRLSEILNLRVADVDLQQQNAVVFGKGGKERVVYFGKTTTEILKRYIVKRSLTLGFPSDDDFFFVTQRNTRLHRRNVLRKWHIIQIKAGVKPLSFHALRHGFARLWILSGGDAFTLQRLLGHSTTAMTNRYLRFFADDLRKVYQTRSPIDHIFGKTNLRK